MKRILYILLIICQLGFGQRGLLSHSRQFTVTYDEVTNTEVVGTFYALYTLLDTATTSVSFAEYYDPAGAYTINSSTGVVTVNNSGNVDYGTDLYIVKTTFGVLTDYDTLTIRVKDTDSCYFINADTVTNGSGTRYDEFDGWDRITLQAGYTYLQKRGTVENDHTVTVNVDGTAGKHISFGAYYVGDRPEFDGSPNFGSNSAIWIQTDYLDIYSFYIYDCEGIGAPSSTYDWKYLTIQDCKFNNCSDNGSIYLQNYPSDYRYKRYTDIMNIEVTSPVAGAHGIKTEASDVDFVNISVTGSDASHKGLSCAAQSSYDSLWYILAKSCGGGGIEINNRSCYIDYSICRNSYWNIIVADTGSVTIRNTIMREASSGGRNLAYWSELHYDYAIVEDCIIDSSLGIGARFLGDIKKIIFRRNKVYSNGDGTGEYGLEINTSAGDDPDTVWVCYNEFWDNYDDDIYISAVDDTVHVYNNFIEDEVTMGANYYDKFYNNFYSSIGGAFDVTGTNIDLDGITPGDYFYDYTNHDYRLKSTAPGAIDAGTTIYDPLLILKRDIRKYLTSNGDGDDVGSNERLQNKVGDFGGVKKWAVFPGNRKFLPDWF